MSYADDVTDQMNRLFAENQDLKQQVKQLQGQIDAAARIHQPVPEAGQGFGKDGRYVVVKRPCGACGTYSEYATPWPCGTARALGLGEEGTS